MRQYQINANLVYLVIDYHRSASFILSKSRWTITVEEEVACFQETVQNNWIDSNMGWGIHGHNNIMLVLGINAFKEDLKIAKFVQDENQNHWHGYPADWHRKAQDRPPVTVLGHWRTNGYISKHKMAKIRSGKKCDL